MTTEREPRIHPAPPLSTPREAPWREIEQVIDGLALVASKLNQVITALGGLPPAVAPPAAPPPTVRVEERLDTLISRLDEFLRRVPIAPAEITLDGRLDSLVRYTRMPLHWGIATGGSLSKLIHRGMYWESNIWSGYECAIIEGSGAGQIRIIKSNNYDSLIPTTDWDTKPNSNSLYVIRLSLRPVSWASQQNVSVTANTNILATSISAQRPSLLRIMCCFSAAGVFNAAITKGGVTETRSFNSGANLTADALYMFDMLTDKDDSVNFQYNTTSTMRLLRIQEIPLATQ